MEGDFLKEEDIVILSTTKHVLQANMVVGAGHQSEKDSGPARNELSDICTKWE